jgi:hypothetical protein
MLMMEAPPAPSDNLDALPAFLAEEWIGKGKTFSLSQTPLHVLQEKQNQLIIPDAHSNIFRSHCLLF